MANWPINVKFCATGPRTLTAKNPLHQYHILRLPKTASNWEPRCSCHLERVYRPASHSAHTGEQKICEDCILFVEPTLLSFHRTSDTNCQWMRQVLVMQDSWIKDTDMLRNQLKISQSSTCCVWYHVSTIWCWWKNIQQYQNSLKYNFTKANNEPLK